jgi:hypothetical protein
MRKASTRKGLVLISVVLILLFQSCFTGNERTYKIGSSKDAIGYLKLHGSNSINYEIEIDTGKPNASYQFYLFGGINNQIGSSIQMIDSVTVNEFGKGKAVGMLKYRNMENLKFNEIVDSNHTIKVNENNKEILSVIVQ